MVPMIEKINVIKTQQLIALLSEPNKYEENFHITITDITLTFKKSQQYKGLKIFQRLCSKKNHSQQKGFRDTMQFLQFKITEYLTILKDGRKCKNPTV